ncbi:MAG TPA: hypothetical protein VMV92_09985 [Streptosporangiaceae bacterium]|nr:hypothetical protein [Streptosporangiaceae bacterium]
MSSNVTALVVAVAGVAGTLASAVIAQVLAMRSRSREIEAQDNQRREDREQALQNTQRADVKTAIAAYLEAAQHLQTQLYAREHGRDFEDVALMVEQIWLAHAQVDILCSERLRLPLVRHAQALNEVARHEERHEDWWDYVLPYKAALMDAIRDELTVDGPTAPHPADLGKRSLRPERRNSRRQASRWRRSPTRFSVCRSS